MTKEASRKKVERYIAAQFDAIANDAVMFPQSINLDHWQWRAIQQVLPRLKGCRILDLGCAKGNFTRALAAEGAKVSGVDVSNKLLTQAKRLSPKIDFRLGSATAIPYADNTFDAIICIEVLEHVPDLAAAITEAARVLKKNGQFIVIDKNNLGLHPIWLYPVGVHKLYLEKRNRWMYPKDAPFRERWFTALGLKRDLRRAFPYVKVHYLQRERHPLIVGVRSLLPWLLYDIMWVAKK